MDSDVVVELPQTREDDVRSANCMCNADELVMVGVCV